MAYIAFCHETLHMDFRDSHLGMESLTSELEASSITDYPLIAIGGYNHVNIHQYWK